MLKTLINHYHALHQIPELDFDLVKTVTYVTNTLKHMHCIIHTPMPCAILAYFDFNKKDTLAFKCDMDALPIEEKTTLAFASIHPHKMHACAHDGHMAILLTLAKYIDDNRNAMNNNILLIFEPAEETSGGAKFIINSEMYQRINPKYIFALHLWPTLQDREIYSKENTILARSNEITISINGVSGHIINTDLKSDAIYIGTQLIQRIYSSLSNYPKSIIRFNMFNSGDATNVSSAKTIIKGTLRCLNNDEYQSLINELDKIKKELLFDQAVQIDININDGYLNVNNSPALYAKASALTKINKLQQAYYASDDFSAYQQSTEGLYALLGIGNVPSLHNSHFHFDESVLEVGLAYFIDLLKID